MLLYGCETWTILKRHESKLQAFEMICLRRVERVTRKDRVRRDEVRKALGQEAVMDIVKEKQRRWKYEARSSRPRGRRRKGGRIAFGINSQS